MLIPYSKIIGSPVVDFVGQNIIGKVSEVVIKKSDISVYGFVLESGLFSQPKVVSSLDIVELSLEAVVVNEPESIVKLSESVRLKEAIEKKYCGIDQRVYTKSGKKFGKVLDYFVESENLSIIRFFVKNFLMERIITRDNIMEFNKRKIIVRDTDSRIPISRVATETV